MLTANPRAYYSISSMCFRE